MVSGIGSNSISSLQLLRASNAFKASKSKSVGAEEESSLPAEELSFKSDFVTENKTKGLNKEFMDEVQNVAQKVGEGVSEDDIKYGVAYGRSILVDYTA